MKKLPPIEKIFEAWTALTDNRVILHGDYADVSSSDGEKAYVVKFADNQYASDDNGTFWQGYAGYPVIAVLMLQGKIPYNNIEAQKWANINWTRQNKEFRNNYREAVADIAKQRNIDLEESYLAADEVMKALSELNIEIKRKIK